MVVVEAMLRLGKPEASVEGLLLVADHRNLGAIGRGLLDAIDQQVSHAETARCELALKSSLPYLNQLAGNDAYGNYSDAAAQGWCDRCQEVGLPRELWPQVYRLKEYAPPPDFERAFDEFHDHAGEYLCRQELSRSPSPEVSAWMLGCSLISGSYYALCDAGSLDRAASWVRSLGLDGVRVPELGQFEAEPALCAYLCGTFTKEVGHYLEAKHGPRAVAMFRCAMAVFTTLSNSQLSSSASAMMGNLRTLQGAVKSAELPEVLFAPFFSSFDRERSRPSAQEIRAQAIALGVEVSRFLEDPEHSEYPSAQEGKSAWKLAHHISLGAYYLHKGDAVNATRQLERANVQLKLFDAEEISLKLSDLARVREWTASCGSDVYRQLDGLLRWHCGQERGGHLLQFAVQVVNPIFFPKNGPSYAEWIVGEATRACVPHDVWMPYVEVLKNPRSSLAQREAAFLKLHEQWVL